MRNTAVKDCKWIGASVVEITFPFEAVGKFKGVQQCLDFGRLSSHDFWASLSLQTLSLLSQAHALRHR